MASWSSWRSACFSCAGAARQTYGPEDTPAGVVRNYVLALQKADYSRAYGYLAENTFQATQAQYQQSMANLAQPIADSSVEIGAAQPATDTETTITLTVVQNTVGLFSAPFKPEPDSFPGPPGG